MNDTLREKLREKLLLFRARKYADKPNGINHYSISLLNDGDFAWHRQELSKSYSLSFKGEIVYDHPITADDLIQSIMTLLGIKNMFSCYFLFDGEACISVDGYDFDKFLMRIFELNGNHDIVLIFTNPDRVLSVGDNEYDIDIHYKVHGLG